MDYQQQDYCNFIRRAICEGATTKTKTKKIQVHSERREKQCKMHNGVQEGGHVLIEE